MSSGKKLNIAKVRKAYEEIKKRIPQTKLIEAPKVPPGLAKTSSKTPLRTNADRLPCRPARPPTGTGNSRSQGEDSSVPGTSRSAVAPKTPTSSSAPSPVVVRKKAPRYSGFRRSSALSGSSGKSEVERPSSTSRESSEGPRSIGSSDRCHIVASSSSSLIESPIKPLLHPDRYHPYHGPSRSSSATSLASSSSSSKPLTLHLMSTFLPPKRRDKVRPKETPGAPLVAPAKTQSLGTQTGYWIPGRFRQTKAHAGTPKGQSIHAGTPKGQRISARAPHTTTGGFSIDAQTDRCLERKDSWIAYLRKLEEQEARGMIPTGKYPRIWKPAERHAIGGPSRETAEPVVEPTSLPHCFQEDNPWQEMDFSQTLEDELREEGLLQTPPRDPELDRAVHSIQTVEEQEAEVTRQRLLNEALKDLHGGN